MKSNLICIIFAILFTTTLCSTPKELETVHQWKDLEFNFPTPQDRQYAIKNGLYVQGNAVPIDVDVDYRQDGSCRVFTTIPRFTSGIPFTLATISRNKGNGGPILEPYPNYSWHSSHGTNCDGITSVFRIAIDACKRLWVLDTGRIDTIQYCPPQLLIFDLRTDRLMHRYRFPQSQYKTGASLFITPIVDVRDPPPSGNCINTKVYIADVQQHGLVVYDLRTDSSWRIENKLMYPDPDWGTFTIAGESFDLMDGMFGMSVTPQSIRGERYLYFHALASPNENAVPLNIIDNRALWINNPVALPDAFKTIGTRNIQSAAEAIDSRGNIYFGLMNPIAIMSWNIFKPYNRNQFRTIAHNPNTLQFTSAMKVVRNLQGKEELWTLTPRFQKIMAGTKNPNEINFRILGCPIDELLSENGSCGSATRNQENLIFN